jgi:class 3 adenylate cyclase/pimeloyl-ACP methyl ester carboxylesterase
MGGEVRYCTTEDGVRIAYKVEGEGPPLVALSAFFESFSLEHLRPDRTNALRRMARGRQLVFLDVHGTGLSDRDITDVSPVSFRRDVDAVVLALGGDRASFLGSNSAGLIILDYAAHYPERVDRLVLHTTFARVSGALSSEALQGLAGLARSNWDLTTRTLADLGSRREGEEVGLIAADWIKRSMTAEFVAALFETNADLDLTPLLPQIQAPTLVLHPVDEPIYPLALGRHLAAAIPNARLITLQHPSYAYENTPGDVLDTINAFLNEGLDLPPPKAAAEPQGPFRTVLFTDVVGHTEMMRRLGDERGREVLRDHERITRETLKAHGGTEVKTMGDGFMASFPSVTRAVECAIALLRAFAERNESAAEPLSIRVGLNAGEPIEEEGDLFGATVILAARIAAQADGSEILASMAVRELCAGKGFLFSDRGEHVLRGFEDPVRMFEISWRTTG